MIDISLIEFSKEVSQIIPYIVRSVMKKQGDVWGLDKITMPQYLLLELIEQHGLLKMKEIAQELSISLPAASGLVNRLFSLQMVKRIYDKKDRRVIYIELTKKGKKVTCGVRRHRKKALQDTFAKLTSKERWQYLSILRRIKDSLYP